jgi:hypothetical protein
VGGGVAANRMIGSFEMPQARGVPVEILDESGGTQKRVPRAADTITTACRIMGLGFDQFFTPGGHGEVAGIRKE